MDRERINKYLSFCIDRLEYESKNDSHDPKVKKDIFSKLDVYRSLKETIEFQVKTSSERQAIRIEWLASLKKRSKSVECQIATIKLYEKVVETLPYLKALNQNGKLNGLINLCYKELDLIDFTYLSFGKRHVDKELLMQEFELAISKSEGDKGIHPEAVNKLRELKDSFEENYKIQPT